MVLNSTSVICSVAVKVTVESVVCVVGVVVVVVGSGVPVQSPSELLPTTEVVPAGQAFNTVFKQ